MTPKKPLPPPPIKTEVQSDQESSNSVDKSEETNSNVVAREINNNQEDQKLKRPSKKSRGRRRSKGWNKKKRRTISNTSKKEEQVSEIKTPTKGKKRKQINDTDEEQLDIKKNEQTSQNKDVISTPIDEELFNDDNLPIALRRSRRTRKAPTNEPPPAISSPTKSISQVRDNTAHRKLSCIFRLQLKRN